MEKLFMSAGIVSAIVLCVVGLFKLPFKSFKEKHPKGYKAVFTALSIVLSVVLSILNELYILHGALLSVDFAILMCAVLAGVFSGYNAYEGLGAKQLVKKIFEKIKSAMVIANTKKAKKYLDKIEDIDEAISILTEKKNQKSESENGNGEV